MKNYRLFADCRCLFAESPMWHKSQDMLYWRGMKGEIYRKKYNDDPTDFECFPLNIGLIGSMVFCKDESILLFADGARVYRWIPGNTPVLLKDFKKSLFNDVICDVNGRIYCGMLADNFFDEEKRGKHGGLYLFDGKDELVCLDNKLSTTPNGIRFSPELDKMYLAVTDDDCVYVYDYCKETGKISNKSLFAKGCCPDGIAIDNDGNLWVANCFRNGPLMCYDKCGNLVEEITFPSTRITSVAFGGKDKKRIFVTTAYERESVTEHDGCVFVIESTVSGCEEYFL